MSRDVAGITAEWIEEDSLLPPGGPKRWWRSDKGVGLAGTPNRVREEVESIGLLREHPACPKLLAHDEISWVLEPLEMQHEDLQDAVTAWAPERVESQQTTHGTLLNELGGEFSVARALEKLGLSRSKVDRFLAQPVNICGRFGPVVGGLHPSWFRRAEDRIVAVRWRNASTRGWWTIDLAGVAFFQDKDLQALHRDGLPDAQAADNLYRLSLLHIALREATLGRSEKGQQVALEAYDELVFEAPQGLVTVRITGPEWLDTSQWVPESGEVEPHQARWLLRNLDGIWVAGHCIAVNTDPPIRAGRGAPRREDKKSRNERLFSRWSEGIQMDEEGRYSVTPEALALEMVSGASGVVMDGTCGVGGLTIALVQQPEVQRVVAVDMDVERLKMARNNAGLYPDIRKIRFLHGTVEEALERFKPDLLVLDPPWGGPSYDKKQMGMDELGMDLGGVLEKYRGPILLKLPRSFNVDELPGDWQIRAAIDDRGQLKFLVAQREELPEAIPSEEASPDDNQPDDAQGS
ncbi:MAG: methyltransferase [Myxococcota bacterium]|nr:methyltransferase [Myxococcota bacterium]